MEYPPIKVETLNLCHTSTFYVQFHRVSDALSEGLPPAQDPQNLSLRQPPASALQVAASSQVSGLAGGQQQGIQDV